MVVKLKGIYHFTVCSWAHTKMRPDASRDMQRKSWQTASKRRWAVLRWWITAMLMTKSKQPSPNGKQMAFESTQWAPFCAALISSFSHLSRSKQWTLWHASTTRKLTCRSQQLSAQDLRPHIFHFHTQRRDLNAAMLANRAKMLRQLAMPSKWLRLAVKIKPANNKKASYFVACAVEMLGNLIIHFMNILRFESSAVCFLQFRRRHFSF